MKRMALLLFALALALLPVRGSTQQVSPSTAPSLVYEVTTPKGLLNVRSQPEAKSDIIAQLPNRTFVLVVARQDGYYQVQLKEEKTGWVAEDFLTETPYGQDVLQYRPLQIGSSGDDVTALKNRLLELGYYRPQHSMSNAYNTTCAVRVRLFQKLNGLLENGIATPSVQAVLYSDQAKENTGDIPTAPKRVVFGRPGQSPPSEEFDWNKFAQENPGACMCCLGQGCECCNYTGRID